MRKITLLLTFLLCGCAELNQAMYETADDMNVMLGGTSSYSAPTLAAQPQPSNCSTDKCRRLDQIEEKGYAAARNGRVSWVKFVDIFYAERARLFPESNDTFGASELRSYQRMLAEQMDAKKITEAQWVYYIEKKTGEIKTRNTMISNTTPRKRTTNCTTTNTGTVEFPSYQTTCD